MTRKSRSNKMPVSTLGDLNESLDQNPERPEPQDVQVADGSFHDPDEVQVDDTKGLNEDPFRSDVALNESAENPHTELDGEEVVDIDPEAPRFPRTGDVNPEPENDEQDALNRITKNVDLLNSEASDKYSLGYDPTFYDRANEATGINEIYLRRTDEAIGIDVGLAQFRTYQNKRGTLTDWEYAQLLQYIAPREVVTGL